MRVGGFAPLDVAGAVVLSVLLLLLAVLGFWVFGFGRASVFLFGLLPGLAVWGILRLIGKKSANEASQ